MSFPRRAYRRDTGDDCLSPAITVLSGTRFIAPLIRSARAGRLGNFINGELWGRVDPDFRFPLCSSPPHARAPRCCRHIRHGSSLFLDTYGVLPLSPFPVV